MFEQIPVKKDQTEIGKREILKKLALLDREIEYTQEMLVRQKSAWRELFFRYRSPGVVPKDYYLEEIPKTDLSVIKDIMGYQKRYEINKRLAETDIEINRRNNWDIDGLKDLPSHWQQELDKAADFLIQRDRLLIEAQETVNRTITHLRKLENERQELMMIGEREQGSEELFLSQPPL